MGVTLVGTVEADTAATADPAGPFALVIARKVLLRNTRIFKQAKSLVEAGYDVEVVGIRPAGAPEHETRDGFELTRLQLDPLYASLPRTLRRRLRDIEQRVRRSQVCPEGLAWGVAALVRATNTASTWLLTRALHKLTLPLRSLDFYRQVNRYVLASGRTPVIVHANDLDTMWVAWRLARRFDAPLVYDAQELYTGLHTLPWWYRALNVAQEWFLMRRASAVIAVNEAIADVMSRRYRRPVDLVVLNCPPLEESAPRDRSTLRAELGLAGDVPIFLYSGALTPQRGIENTVRALKYVDRGALVVLGEGPLRPVLDELVAEHGLEGRVFFFDFVRHEQVPSFVAGADVGVVPYENVGVNHYLCSPSKLFHYIAAELPVACSDFPFLRSVVVENGLGATFDPSNPRSIAAALDSIVSDADHYAAIRSRLAVARRRYCWEVEGQKFLDLYRTIDPVTVHA